MSGNKIHSIHSPVVSPFPQQFQSSCKSAKVPQPSSITDSLQWFIRERGGIGKIIGKIMVPSQHLGPDRESANLIVQHQIRHLRSNLVDRIERVEIVGERGVKVQGVVIYPKGWDPKFSKCVIYNNPNAVTVPDFLSYSFDADVTPFQILRKAKCPLIMYDYRGTGISRSEELESSSSADDRPSAYTIAQDGHAVLSYALKRFEHADVWGSSLGGGVATVACEAFLQKNPEKVDKIHLYNHDSFTTTGKVVLPKYLNFVATLLGGNLDAESSMRRLAKKGLNISVLYHKEDPVIREGSRMAEIVAGLPGKIRLIESRLFGHADLSHDLLEQIY